MRMQCLAVALVLLMAGAAVGQSEPSGSEGYHRAQEEPGPSGEANATPGATDEPAGNATHGGDGASGTNGTNSTTAANGTAPAQRPRPECGAHEGPACRALLWQHRMPSLRHINFIPADDGVGLRNYRVDGDLLLAELQYLPAGNLSVLARAEGHRFMLNASGDHLAFHDTNTGLILFDGSHGRVRLVLPDDAQVQQTGFGLRYTTGGTQAMLLSQAVQAEDGVLWLDGYFSLIKRPGDLSKRPVADQRPAAEQPLIDDALGRRHLAAEVAVDPSETADVLTYDAVNVTVAVPRGSATPEDPIRIEVSADLPEGRAVAVTIDPARLRGQELQLRYFDIHEGRDGSRIESELVFPMADSLQDALDPTNDGGQPEYWIVRDRDGVQAILVFPHWSVHAVTIASIGEVLVKPNVVFGAVLGAVVAAAAGFVMFRPRRQ